MSTTPSFQNQALITGTSDYYRLLYLNEDDKAKAINLAEILQRMEQLVAHSNETQLHLTRVNWWQQQIQAMSEQKATLPAVQSVQTDVVSGNLNIQLLDQTLQAISEEFFLTSFKNNGEQQSWSQRRFGMFNMAQAQLLGADTSSIASFIQHSAEVEGYCYLLNQRASFYQRGVVPFSQELLSNLSISAKQLLQDKELEPHKKLAQHIQTSVSDSWTNALKQLPDDQQLMVLPTLIKCSIFINWLKKIEKANFPLYDQHIDVLAIKKFWLAWRWYRKAK